MIQKFAFFCNKYLTLRYFFHNSVTIGKGLFLCVKKTVVFFTQWYVKTRNYKEALRWKRAIKNRVKARYTL